METNKQRVMNAFRLLLIMDQEARPVMQRVFFLGAPQKDENDTLKDYLVNIKNLSNTRYRNSFNRTQRDTIDDDPSCKSFDISLWLPAIQYGCVSLAEPNDATWFENPDSLENHLKRIKDNRNNIMHGAFSITTPELFARVEEIRKLLVDTLNLAREKYNSDQPEMNDVISQMETNINKLRDDSLIPKDIKDYENIPLTNKLKERLKDIGVKDLKNLFENMSYLNPASKILGKDLKLEVKLIFTELEIVKRETEEGNDPDPIEYTDLLMYAHKAKKDAGSSLGQIILIDGIAGIGKTALLQLLLSCWASCNPTIKELNHYEFIIHMECRNSSISSLSDLISYQLREARKSFRSEKHMLEILFEFPVLIMVDGLDEMNSKSKDIFKEIVNIKRIENITIICTTRPDTVEDYDHMVPDDIQTLRFKIKGIPKQFRELFLRRYHDELIRIGHSKQDTQALLSYFKTRAVCLKDHWRKPLNLALLALLWAVHPKHVNRVTTAIELYEQIHKLILEKIVSRLVANSTEVLDGKRLRTAINVFVAELCRNALIGLRDDDIILKEEAVEDLRKLCYKLKIPHAEVLGAFLIQENHDQSVIICRSSFPHKELQEYYASCALHDRVTGLLTADAVEVEQRLQNFIGQLPLGDNPPLLYHGIITDISERFKTFYQTSSSGDVTILNTLEKLYGQQPNSSILKKLQNVFILLIGLIAHETNEENDVDKKLAEELIDLLKRSGLHDDQEAWIRVLNTVKCHKYVAELITQIPGIYTNTVEVSDDNVFAYSTIFKIRPPKDVGVSIKTSPSHIPRMFELFKIITEHEQCHVKELSLESTFRHLSDGLQDTPLESFITELMTRCKLKKYKGNVTAKMNLPKTINVLFASVSDAGSYKPLQKFLRPGPPLMELRLCFNKGIDPTDLQRLKNKCLLLCLPDVEDTEDIDRVTEMAKRLQPTDSKNCFSNLLFPRCSLTLEKQCELIQKLNGVKVDWAVYFPVEVSSAAPMDENQLRLEKEKLKEFAKGTLQSKNGVIWGGYGIQDWDE